jgi:hypothetical protein
MNDLNSDNFLLYAMKAYDRPNAIQSEFDEDLKRLKYVKRLIKRYRSTGDLKERLILNHIIILANVFGIEATVRMLFYKLDEEDYSVLKTFLLFLEYMPKVVLSINGRYILSKNISIDLHSGRRLREI